MATRTPRRFSRASPFGAQQRRLARGGNRTLDRYAPARPGGIYIKSARGECRMSEEEKSPTGESRAVEVSSDLTNSPPVPTTQEDRTISLTRKKHDAIYFDPPGSIRNWSPNGTAIFH